MNVAKGYVYFSWFCLWCGFQHSWNWWIEETGLPWGGPITMICDSCGKGTRMEKVPAWATDA